MSKEQNEEQDEELKRKAEVSEATGETKKTGRGRKGRKRAGNGSDSAKGEEMPEGKSETRQKEEAGKKQSGAGRDSRTFGMPFLEMLQDLFEHAGETGGKVEIHQISLPMFGENGSGEEGTGERRMRRRAERPAAEVRAAKEDPFQRIREFQSTPRELRAYLDRFVVSQEQAKRVLSVAVCDHYHHVRNVLQHPELDGIPHAKHNVLLMGPSGCGKTYLMRCLAGMLGVPFIKADATKYSQTGYMGYDVEDMVRDLVKAANGNVDLAQYGIIYIDEIDKLANAGGEGNGHPDVSGRGVQVNLLKMMEDTDVKVLGQGDMFSSMRAAMNSGVPQKPVINTRNILFIVSGAFDQLAEVVRRREGHARIGFGGGDRKPEQKQADAELLQQVRTEDLVAYGFESEFVGRLPVRVALSPLNVEDLQAVLCNVENGFLSQYVEAFRGYGIELQVRSDALRKIAEKAAEEKTGARGLLTVLEHLFRNFKYELPGTGIGKLEITAETLEDPERYLQKLLGETAGR